MERGVSVLQKKGLVRRKLIHIIFLVCYLTEHHCPHYEPPLHGTLNCERRLHNRFCTVSCNENYEFSQEPDVSYFCANIENTMEMAWQPPPYGKLELNMPWPDCSSKFIHKNYGKTS